MSYSYTWQNDNGIYVQYHGDVNLDDFININREISQDRRYSFLSHNLSDLREVKSLKLNQKELEMLAHFHGIPSCDNPGLRLAIVCSKNAIQKKAEAYKNYMQENSWEIQVFDQFKNARLWAADQVNVMDKKNKYYD